MDELVEDVAREALEQHVREILRGYRATLQADRRHLWP